VLESVPNYMNFPADDPMTRATSGTTAAEPGARRGDLVLVLDSDVRGSRR